jgi:hypothetical protein
MSQDGFLQLAAKLAREIGDIDESDLIAAPQMVVHLGDRSDARSSILKGTANVVGLRAAGLDAKQSYDRSQAVLDAVAHLPRQHGLMVEGSLELGVGMLPFDCDAEQASEAGEKVGVREVELAGVRAVDFKDTEWKMAFTAPRDKDIDGALDSVIR